MQREPAMSGSGVRTAAGAICLLLSGAGALFYELVWSHQFSIVFGSSEIATASVLGVYLAGLGFGAAIALRRCRTNRRPLRVYALLEITIGISALFVPVGLRWSQGIFYRVAATDALPAASFGGSWFWELAITALLLAVPTLALGASFPYAVRGLVLDDRRSSHGLALQRQHLGSGDRQPGGRRAHPAGSWYPGLDLDRCSPEPDGSGSGPGD